MKFTDGSRDATEADGPLPTETGPHEFGEPGSGELTHARGSQRDGADAIAGYRRVTRDQLIAILREIDGMPPQCLEAMAEAVWGSVPRHPKATVLWAHASRAVSSLEVWLRVAEGLPANDRVVLALQKIAVLTPTQEGRGYSTLVRLGVDVLRAGGLRLRSSRSSVQRGAFDVMADVLYWVWRKPDPRARGLIRDGGSLGSVYWRARRANPALAQVGAIEHRPPALSFIWIPARPPPWGRNL